MFIGFPCASIWESCIYKYKCRNLVCFNFRAKFCEYFSRHKLTSRPRVSCSQGGIFNSDRERETRNFDVKYTSIIRMYFGALTDFYRRIVLWRIISVVMLSKVHPEFFIGYEVNLSGALYKSLLISSAFYTLPFLPGHFRNKPNFIYNNEFCKINSGKILNQSSERAQTERKV